MQGSPPWRLSACSRWAVLATLVVSLAGASVGLFLATRGLAPNTTIDVVYHVALVAWLLATAIVAWRTRD